GPIPAQAFIGFLAQQDMSYRSERAPLPDNAKWAYRTVSEGYEFELFLPWNLLGRSSAPTSGTAIALNLGLGTSNDPNYWAWWPTLNVSGGSGMLRGQAFLAINSPGGTTSCRPNNDANPWCDDRTWCRPSLE